VGLAPTGKRRLCTAHANTGSRQQELPQGGAYRSGAQLFEELREFSARSEDRRYGTPTRGQIVVLSGQIEHSIRQTFAAPSRLLLEPGSSVGIAQRISYMIESIEMS
jgi:hypothetical protein